jgi:hypothetical protein
MIIQLASPLPLKSPLGNCLAHLVIDYGLEEKVYFVCFQDDSGECWVWNNQQVKAQRNTSYGRTYTPMDEKKSKEEIKTPNTNTKS